MKSSTVCSSWIDYFNERFPLYVSLPLIALFVLANEAVALMALKETFHPMRTGIAFLMCVSFFYRLVIFSDIRNYANDSLYHRESPMVRGLVTVQGGTVLALLLIVFEMALTLIVGIQSFLAHLLPISWSLLMWREFFVPSWLQRHPLSYALIRAPVLAFCGYSVGVTTLEVSLLDFTPYFYFFGLVNFALFLLFTLSVQSGDVHDDINFQYLLGRKLVALMMFGSALLVAVVGANIWLGAVVVVVGLAGFFWVRGSKQFSTALLHRIICLSILYTYFVFSVDNF